MRLHILHDWGLWSPAHMANGALELRQYRHCRVCAKLDHRLIGKMSSGRFDAEIADANRTETLQALPVDGSVQRHLLHVEDRVRAIEQHLVL